MLFGSLAPVSVDELFKTLPGCLFLGLFEKYSDQNFRVGSLCELMLRGPLKEQVRSMLPKLLPALVLDQNETLIQDVRAMLEESVESLFTPQLPFILSAIAEQPLRQVTSAFGFILDRVYSNQMTMASICDASLGKLLVLIFWNGGKAATAEQDRSEESNRHTVAHRRTLMAITNVVEALKGKKAEPQSSEQRKRGGETGEGSLPPAKRRLGREATVISVGSEGAMDVDGGAGDAIPAMLPTATKASAEVIQTLVDSFLHVLDIFEIVLTGNRESPKWAEYSALVCDYVGSDRQLNYGRLFASISLLLGLIPEQLHSFAPKVLEFLQSATVLSGHHAGSLRCWQYFVHYVGIQRLKPFVPTVVGELLQLASRLRQVNPGTCRTLCAGLLGSLVESTCRKFPDVATSLPSLPAWPELQSARVAVESAASSSGARGFPEKVEAGVARLESATQQAVRSAALDHIKNLLVSQRRDSPSVIAELRDPLLGRLMRAVLTHLWESSAVIGDRLKCGEILGAVGAIDPSRFANVEMAKSRASQTLKDVGNAEALALRVLSDFLAPNLTSRNAHAFAAQEILKYLRSRHALERTFSNLSESACATLRPYQSSSYQLIEPAQSLADDVSTFEGVAARAIALVQGEQRAFFEACLPAVEDNLPLAQFLMHHILRLLLTSATPLTSLDDLSGQLAGLLNAPQHATVQAVFSLVDDLMHRCDQLHWEPAAVNMRPADVAAKANKIQRVEHLLKSCTSRKITTAAIRCGAHARALQFLELAIVEEARASNPFDSPKLAEDDCILLQSIYRHLDEPDGVLGALRVGPLTASTRALQLEQSSRWQELLARYEEQLALLPGRGGSGVAEPREELLCGLVRCTQNLRRFESSLRLIHGLCQEGDDMQTRLKPFAVEAAWQLSSWGRLESVLEAPSRAGAPQLADDFQIQLGQALQAFHERKELRLKEVLRGATESVTLEFASAAKESYMRAYQHLLKLHVLADLGWLWDEKVGAGASKPHGNAAIAQNLLDRAQVTAPTFPARQLVLSPTRVVLRDLGLLEDSKHLELSFVRLGRKHNVAIAMEHPSTSFASVSRGLLSSALLEWGKLLYARGYRHDALQHMERLAAEHPKARLLGTRWATEASSELLLPKVAEAEFKCVKEKLPEDEAAWFYHASYLDHLLKDQLSSMKTASPNPVASAPRILPGTTGAGCPFDMRNLVTLTVRGYLQALCRGNKRVHFILNRVLQLAWDLCELEMHKQEVLEEISKQAQHMQPWMWYQVLPQLISRIQHPDMKPVFYKLIQLVLAAYPEQAGWQLVQLLKSKDVRRKELGNSLVQDTARHHKAVSETMFSYDRICTTLIELTEHCGVDNSGVMALRSVPNLQKLLGNSTRKQDAWQLLIPLQSQMTAVVPSLRSRDAIKKFTTPFTEHVTTKSCLDHVDVFRTKERPKKLTFLGSDGNEYPFLCKMEKRGDLRKDSRMMEICVMVNQLLNNNADTRRRNLSVRTYNVVILTENTGMLEWVPNTKGMRPIIDELWKHYRPGRQQSVREIKDLFDRSKDLYEVFTNQVLPRNPPVMNRWFASGADPSVWFSRRLLFSRSQALWCMLGYIVGLGDRHGENILLDIKTGRMVQVDFDCLFGKGMMLDRPETVPFRLTQNCVAALGITGVEGIFRQSCELCMGVLRDRANKQTLLSVLHVFIADPLIEWARVRTRADNPEDFRIQQGRSVIVDIEKKLNGMLNVGAVVKVNVTSTHADRESVLSPEERGKGLLGRDRGVGLSVAGQVDELLKAAMCKHNLSEMYVGWQAWM